MRYLFVLLLLVGCSGNCGSIDGLEVPDMSKVPGDYTGVAFSCYRGYLFQMNNYKDGKKDGISRRWRDPIHGFGHILEFEVNYKDRKIIDNKIVNYNENGSIYNTEYYEDDKLVRCEGWC